MSPFRFALLGLALSQSSATSAWCQAVVQAPTPTVGASEALVRWRRAPAEVETSSGARRPLREGESLSAGAHVHVGEGGAAELVLSNGTSLLLDPRSQLVLFGSPTPPAAGFQPSTTTTLHRGSMRVVSAVDASAQSAPLVPIAAGHVTAFVGRSVGSISVDSAAHTVRVAAHRGRVRLRLPDREYILRPGNGAVEELGRPRGPYRQLPQAPVWLAPPPAQVLTTDPAVDLPVTWTRRGNAIASGWRVEVARDEGFHDVVSAEPFSRSVTSGLAHGLVPGRYFIRVTTLSGDGFESLPSPVASVMVAAPRFVAGARGAPDAPGRAAELQVPSGFFCGVDGGRPVATDSPIRFVPGRRHEVRCTTSQDGSGDVRRVEVTAEQSGPLLHEVRSLSTSLGQSVVTVRLLDGARGAVPYADISTSGDQGVLVEALRETAQRGVYTARMHWPAGVRRARVRFTVNDTESFEETLAQGE